MNIDTCLLIISNVITGVGCGVVGFAMAFIAFDLEWVARTQEHTPTDRNDMKDVHGASSKNRRLKFSDYILAILMIGLAVSLISQIITTNKAADASNKAASALARVQEQNDCLTGFANKLADALDRRQNDSVKYQMIDAARDKILVNGLANPDRVFLDALKAATVAKQNALADLNAGRASKKYPQAPREVCSK